MVFGGLFGGRVGKSGFGSSSTAEQVVEGLDLSGKVAVVTGASSGIGVETARALSSKGAHVVLAVRNIEAGEATKADILKGSPKAQVKVMSLDLSSFDSIRSFATKFEETKLPLHILINNAGVMMCPFQKTKDGHELQFGTNHLGHFLLTDLLLDSLKQTAQQTGTEGRIVCLSSLAHVAPYKEGIRFDKLDSEEGYSMYRAYGQSKLANILHANELARRLKAEGANVTANSVHPGSIATNLVRHLPGFVQFAINTIVAPFLKSAQQGAATSVYVAAHPDVKGVSGEYFADCNVAERSAFAKDAAMGERLWQVSEALTAKYELL